MNFKHLFIDHESFSAADLKKCGSYAYAEHPTTEIMLTTYAFDDGPVYCYDATDGGPMPRDLGIVLGAATVVILLFIVLPGPIVSEATAAAQQLFQN